MSDPKYRYTGYFFALVGWSIGIQGFVRQAITKDELVVFTVGWVTSAVMGIAYLKLFRE